MNVSKGQYSNNPIKDILVKLGTNTIPVTLQYLQEVAEAFEPHGLEFPTYGDVFKVLKYLEEKEVVKLIEQEQGTYKITGLYNYGE